jgi:signal transduction histidine kinase
MRGLAHGASHPSWRRRRVGASRPSACLRNLLANAAKFTDPGGHIRLSAEAEGGQVVLRVRDNGRGIAPDLLPRVFDLFQQGGDPCGNDRVGLGLGLALVKTLVERHGGSVAACSDGPGTGAEFVVRLPVRARGS